MRSQEVSSLRILALRAERTEARGRPRERGKPPRRGRISGDYPTSSYRLPAAASRPESAWVEALARHARPPIANRGLRDCIREF